MSVIPFGLVGAIYGHHFFDVPLSMFSVVGLLGMAGIIINDSIVLVSTVDEYAKDRGIIPSIIDGAADRLRPVFLTTATTVIGLAPLLSEKSQQAQFLKPTVITLTFGLGFGMFLVLMLVPAVLAIQSDVSRQVQALRRARKSPQLNSFLLASMVAIAFWGAICVRMMLVEGAAPAMLGVLSPLMTLGLFGAGTAVICLMAYAVGGVIFLRRGSAFAEEEGSA
jgi:predicted RND superfamily exporter protein